jgi:hypothetical protein
VVGWGYNESGQTISPEGGDFIAIAAGGEHSLALKKDGRIVAWGDNYYGQAIPPAGNNFISIAASGDQSLALTEDGGISCQYILAGDLDGDCMVGFSDFAVTAQNWLVDCNSDPNNPGCLPK